MWVNQYRNRVCLGVLLWAASSSLLLAETRLLTSATCVVGAEALQRSELYFGLSRPDGSTISDSDFQAFIDQEVTPRFPDGLTVVHGYGQWRQQDGKIVRESSRVLVLLHKQSAENHIEIESLRALYRQRFKQESVLRVDSISCVSF